jgi:hypothetical protein
MLDKEAGRESGNRFTRYCRAFEKDVKIMMLPDQLPFCEETCTKDGICDDRVCARSVANAISAKARAETQSGGNLWEEWISNLLRADFPFVVDYTETAWDPCSIPIAACKDGESVTFMADNKAVAKCDCTMPRSLQKNCLQRTIASGDLAFASLGITGYDNDPRGLFQIPEVIRWVSFCESQIPDLATWLAPRSIVWLAIAAFNASEEGLSRTEQGLPIEFYREWVKRCISAASHVLERHNVGKTQAERVIASMWHKAGWALHEGWGAWFRGVPYRLTLAQELWQYHRPLTTSENLDYNMALLDRIRKQALSTEGT